MKKKYIQLPKGYLSYSQIQLWKTDPEKYIDIYMDGRDELRTTNMGQDYGKVVATALEKGGDTGDLLTDSAMLLLKKYDVADEEIRVEYKTKYGWLVVLAKPDTRNSKTNEFREYKTGKYAWTAKKAQDHPQMIFYAMAIYLKFKTALKEAYLDWIETEQVEVTRFDDTGRHIITVKEIRPTGRVESFRVTFTLKQILREMAETVRVAREIESAFVSHITKPEIPF